MTMGFFVSTLTERSLMCKFPDACKHETNVDGGADAESDVYTLFLCGANGQNHFGMSERAAPSWNLLGVSSA